MDIGVIWVRWEAKYFRKTEINRLTKEVAALEVICPSGRRSARQAAESASYSALTLGLASRRAFSFSNWIAT
jgi:hypothetical protein